MRRRANVFLRRQRPSGAPCGNSVCHHVDDADMTGTWIVGVDGSDDSRVALEWAVAQAKGRAVRIVVLAAWGSSTATGELQAGTAMMSEPPEFELELQAR